MSNNNLVRFVQWLRSESQIMQPEKLESAPQESTVDITSVSTEIDPLSDQNMQTPASRLNTAIPTPISPNVPKRVSRIKSANRVKSASRERRLNSASSAFHCQTKAEESKLITATFIKEAQETGVVKLIGQGIQQVPHKLWKIQSLQVDNLEDQYRFDRKQDFCWWHQKTIQHLDLSSNAIIEIPSDIQELADLVSLNLHDNAIQSLPDDIGFLRNLSRCDLSRNKLTKISEGICQLSELTKLNLSKNEISIVPLKLTDLILLEELDLSENTITKLPRGFGFLIRLIELNLARNKIVNLPPDIVNLRDLRKLDVSHNTLKSLPDMGELRKLEFLYANHNKLMDIPSMTGCHSLKECYFGHNNIKFVTSEFCKDMASLKVLDIPHNKIEVLPDEVASLQQLVRFNVSNNSLQYLPTTLCLLPHLQTLTVEGNVFKTLRRDVIACGTSRIVRHLRERYESDMIGRRDSFNGTQSDSTLFIPGEVKYPDRYTMRQTRALNVANRGLSDVPMEVFEDFAKVEATSMDLCKNNFIELPKGLELTENCLTELNISYNKLTELPEYLGNFTHLKYLNASKNQFTTIPDCFCHLQKLRELDMSSNRLTCIPNCIYQLEGLEILQLRDNKVTHLDSEALLKMPRLAVLDLVNNNIAQIPPILGNMKQLRSLELFGNCFRQPTHHVLEKGTEAVLAYLRDKIPT